MDEMSLIRLFKRGFLPGPQESEELLLRRVAIVEEAAKEPEELLGLLGFQSSQLDLSTGFRSFPPFCFDWLLVVKSFSKLSLWEGGATWLICQSESIALPIVQLKPHSRFIDTEEVFQHESVHILRSAFHEPRFEESLAYLRSRAKWRAYWGPVVRTYKETRILVSLLFIALAGQLLFFTWLSSLLLWLLPLAYIGYLVVRMMASQRLFRVFMKRLESRFSKERAPILALFFTDEEIELLARTPDEAQFYDHFKGDLRSRLFSLVAYSDDFWKPL